MWLRGNMRAVFGLLGGLMLAVCGIIPTSQPAHFGRIYAAHGGIFIVFSLIWGFFVDKKIPDIYEIIGVMIAFVDVFIMFYVSRYRSI
ncbi:YnfA family protein [Methanosarcina sp. T3]|uniref:YnfA family protein n=1 Tax=Methanosarcina sp. T3 TaxID=3439062 RepID=UPI003F849AD3